jgi:hypothetical protein
MKKQAAQIRSQLSCFSQPRFFISDIRSVIQAVLPPQSVHLSTFQSSQTYPGALRPVLSQLITHKRAPVPTIEP